MSSKRLYEVDPSMRVTLRRVEGSDWLLFAERDGSIVASVTMRDTHEVEAIKRAETMAGWFDAELVLEKVVV